MAIGFVNIGLPIAIGSEGEAHESTREFCIPRTVFLSSGGVGCFVAGISCGLGRHPYSAGTGCRLSRDPSHAGCRCLGRGIEMKYLFACLLGVPGILIILWFLLNHS
jgi:hypothetical protein